MRVKVQLIKLYHLFRYGDSGFPRAISIEINTACNRSCYYCANSSLPRHRQEFMPEPLYRVACSRIAELSWRGPVTFHWFSEPTMDGRLPDLVEILKRTAPRCRPLLYTNADFLDSGLLDKLRAAGLRRVYVTRHPPLSQDWDERVTSLQEQFGRFIVRRGHGGIVESEPWLSNFGGAGRPSNYTPLSRCHFPSQVMQIYFNGHVGLCCAYPERISMGNILKSGLLETWNGETFRDLRAELIAGHPKLGPCRKCFTKLASLFLLAGVLIRFL